jgi:hypothetical protein
MSSAPLMYTWPCWSIILNIDGSLVRKISTHGVNYNLLYNERNDQLLLRQDGERLCCINLDGHVIYRYDISGYQGLALSFIKYKNSSFIKYKNPSFIKYKNLSFIKYKNLSFTTIN